MSNGWPSDQELLERCDVCHRLVSVFVLVIEASEPYRMLCNYCRPWELADPDSQLDLGGGLERT